MNDEFLHNIKVTYNNGRHRYFSKFSKENYERDVRIGSIVNMRPMTKFEKILYGYEDMSNYGYTWPGMLPITFEEAVSYYNNQH